MTLKMILFFLKSKISSSQQILQVRTHLLSTSKKNDLVPEQQQISIDFIFYMYVISIPNSETAKLFNITVCVGKTGPERVLGGGNVTIQDIYEAVNYNRTLERSARRDNVYKPSPSPSVSKYARFCFLFFVFFRTESC
jgi:hypothetical protein